MVRTSRNFCSLLFVGLVMVAAVVALGEAGGDRRQQRERRRLERGREEMPAPAVERKRAEAIHLKRRVAALHGAGDGTDDEVKKQEFMKLAAEQRAKDEGEAGRSGDGLAATRNKARGNKASNKKGGDRSTDMKRMMRTFWPRSKTCLGEKGIVIKDTEQRDSVTLDAVKCFLKRDAPEAKDGDDKEVKSVDLAVDPEASLKHLCRMASNAADGNNKQMREAFKACKSGFVDISEVRDGSGNHPMSGWIDKHLQSLEKEQELELCKEKFNQQTEETPKQETGSTCLEELRIHQCVKKDSGRRDSQAAGNEDKDGLVLNWADMPRVLKCAAKGTSLASRKPETAAVRSAAPGVARIKNKGARNGKGEQRKGKGNGKKGQKAKRLNASKKVEEDPKESSE